MPSAIPGNTSGGEQLISGNPYNGRSTPYTGVMLVLDNYALSGAVVYVGFSGGVTMASGGGMSSGGLNDGYPLYPGQTQSFPLPPTGLAGVYLAVPSNYSGQARVFWNPLGRT